MQPLDKTANTSIYEKDRKPLCSPLHIIGTTSGFEPELPRNAYKSRCANPATLVVLDRRYGPHPPKSHQIPGGQLGGLWLKRGMYIVQFIHTYSEMFSCTVQRSSTHFQKSWITPWNCLVVPTFINSLSEELNNKAEMFSFTTFINSLSEELNNKAELFSCTNIQPTFINSLSEELNNKAAMFSCMYNIQQLTFRRV